MGKKLQIDACRAISVMMVVGFQHVRGYSEYYHGMFPSRFCREDLMAMALGTFFFLSSYCLGKKYAINGVKDALAFFVNRFLRLFPLYAVSLFTLPYATDKWIKIGALVGANNFYRGIDGGNIMTLWFMSVLLVFYVILALMLGIRRYVVRLAVGLAFEALFCLGAMCFHWEFRLTQYFPCFLLGLLLVDMDWQRIGLLSAIPALAFVPLAVSPGFPMRSIIMPICGMSVVVWVSELLCRIPHAKNAISWIAYSSMCAYMFHRQIFNVFVANDWLVHDGLGRVLQLYLVCVPMAFGCGWLIQKGYDWLRSRFDFCKHTSSCGLSAH